MRDDLRNRITGNGANEALSGLQQTLYEQLTAGRSLHEAIAALMTATERQMPGSHCAVLATWQAAPSPFLMHAVSDTLIEALDAADSSRQLDDWLAALMKEPGAPAALSFSALRASPALHGLYSAVSAGGVDDGLIAPIVLLDGRPIGMVLAGFDRMPARPAACAVLEHAALLTAMVIQRHCSDARKAEYDLFRTAFDTALDATIVADAEGEAIVSVNSALTALLGYGAEELIGSTFSSLHEDPVGVMPLPDAGSATCRLRCKNGDILPAQCSMRIAEAGGRMMMFVTVRDATPKRAAEDSLTLTGKVYETMGEGAIIAGEDSVILSVNRALQAMTGYSTDEMVGRVPEFLYGEPTQWRRLVAHCMQTGLRGEEEIFVRHKDGRFFPCLLSVSVIRDDGGPSRIVAIYKDISLRRRQENHLRFLANHDVLTRLPNRTQFYKRLDMVIADANRDARSFAVLFIDLDRFKTVNDTFGHSAGDLLLQMVAERLRRNVRKTDMLARLGGDEFTVLAEMMPDVRNVMVLADHIMTALEEPFHIEGHELFVTASVGVSVFPHDGRDAETLIKSADTAMYHAKGLGKNNYQFFLAEMNTKALEHLQLESALRHALERNEFMLYYQPKVQVSTEDIFGMEALLRWNHPALGIIGPGRFIPLAEETGMIREIGCWALREACRQNAVWQRAGYPSLVVSVNLSSLQLVTLDFAETVAGILKETGLHASCLELELTESAIMESPEQSSITLQALRDMGVQISIDDFGTGYSSLSYLKRFPINTLKIDQSFVRDINIDANDAAITDAVISLARSLNMEVIAEGVETPEQLRYLQRNGCDAYQGFLFSRPLPSGEFQQLLTMNPPE